MFQIGELGGNAIADPLARNDVMGFIDTGFVVAAQGSIDTPDTQIVLYECNMVSGRSYADCHFQIGRLMLNTTPHASPPVQMTHTSKRFGRAHAVANVSIASVPGEGVGVFGPNGARTSCLMRLHAEAEEALHQIGPNVRNLQNTVVSLCVGQRQVRAIARALFFQAIILSLILKGAVADNWMQQGQPS
ncbi:hypothetical protein IV417_07215 [Alphaproteobacteria bacterium KMM 3653]|uniref:Uncharacterized protein n=1 Tax=Harenicola maris TaxID=2841044 RepID=A0AAP2CT66_9RHOB|nr:hypothetical protein [Harenicola maris]